MSSMEAIRPDEGRPDETERMRRHLRALSAVNRQLHAQLEGRSLRPVDPTLGHDDLLAGTGGEDARIATLSIRRASSGSTWIEQLQLLGGGSDPFLVGSPKRGWYLIEGPLRRRIKAGMLFAALEGVLGAPREVRADELDRWLDGPPVEVLEGASGPAFIVVAGRRLPLRGLPLPHPVTTDEMLRFPEGEELRVGMSAGGAVRPSSSSARALTLLRREGVVRGGGIAAKKAARRLVRRLRGSSK
jgi:hypothetical protein